MRASSLPRREPGIATLSCDAPRPLRIRVRKSATGSVIDMRSSPLLPAALGDAGDESVVGQLPEADPADAELAVHRAGPAAAPAASVAAGLELRRALLAHPL